jgi:hypothetical protein
MPSMQVCGIAFILRTMASKRVATVLDLDSTLVESERLDILPADWWVAIIKLYLLRLASVNCGILFQTLNKHLLCRASRQWRLLDLVQRPCGQAVEGRVCSLPDEVHHAESVHGASWAWKGLENNYRVRQRLGWSGLRDLLIQVSMSQLSCWATNNSVHCEALCPAGSLQV